MIRLDHYWPSPPRHPRLSRHDIHVWMASLEQSHATLETLAQSLSVEELTRARGYFLERDRTWFIARRGILRSILSRYLGTEPNVLRFSTGRYGKPALEEPFRGLGFNLSHSHGLALLAIGRDAEIGADLEEVRSLDGMDAVAEQIFTANENLRLGRLIEPEKLRAFYRIWTRNEASIKARGIGLGDSAASISASADVTNSPVSAIGREQPPVAGWSLYSLSPAAGFEAAVAVKGRRWRFACWSWSDQFACVGA